MYAYLLEADAWTGSGVETLRMATHTVVTGPTETPPNTVYEGRLSDAGSITRTLVSGGTLGRASVSYGFLELANASGALDGWYDYGFDGRAFACGPCLGRGCRWRARLSCFGAPWRASTNPTPCARSGFAFGTGWPS
jgi:hypothetical protein